MPDPRPTWRRWTSRLLPWVISAVVVAVLLQRYSPDKMLFHLSRGNGWALAMWALVATVSSLLLMSTADWILFRASIGSLSWRQVVRGRGGMSLIAAVSYGIGQGGYGLWIARVSRSPLTKSIGLIAYIMLSDLIVVCALGAVALAGSELRVGPDLAWVGRLAPVAALGLLALGLLGPRILPRLVGSGRFASLVSPWSEVGSASFVASLAVRLVNILLAIGVTWAAARAFGIDAPAGAFLSFLPIIYLVSALPINVGPFGAVQFAWLYFFEPYGEGEQILAFQVVFSTMLTVGWALRGLPFVSSVAREIELGGAEAAATEKTPEA